MIEEEIKQLSDNIRSGDYSQLTESAIKIAKLALTTYDGDLLRKALDISIAIVEFEDAYTRKL